LSFDFFLVNFTFSIVQYDNINKKTFELRI